MIARVEQVEADIREVDSRIEAQLAPLAPAAARLLETPGIGSAPQPHHRRDQPGHDPLPDPGASGRLGHVRARRQGIRQPCKGNGSTGHGNRYLARVLDQIAVTAARTDTFLGERYRRIARRRGAKRATVAVGRSILTIIWHLLSAPDTHYRDLGADFCLSRTDAERRNHIRQLKALGYDVTLDLAASPPHPPRLIPRRYATRDVAARPITVDFRVSLSVRSGRQIAAALAARRADATRPQGCGSGE